jgi:hypothetical protein
MWTNTYGKGVGSEERYALIEHSIDNGFVIGGQIFVSSTYNMMLIETDSAGVEQWTKGYGGAGIMEWVNDVIECSVDNGFLMAGISNGFGAGSQEAIIVRTDSSGVQMWTKTYGGTTEEHFSAVIEHSIDFGFAFAGTTNSFGAGLYDALLVKTDASGVEQWAKTYGGVSSERAQSIIEYSVDNGFVLAGYTGSFSASDDFMLIKTNSLGVEQWTKSYGGTGADFARAVIQCSGGWIRDARRHSQLRCRWL